MFLCVYVCVRVSGVFFSELLFFYGYLGTVVQVTLLIKGVLLVSMYILTNQLTLFAVQVFLPTECCTPNGVGQPATFEVCSSFYSYLKPPRENWDC